jgi:hypothetical protein
MIPKVLVAVCTGVRQIGAGAWTRIPWISQYYFVETIGSDRASR